VRSARPSIVSRHSKQIPIPQSGPRGRPVTDRRNPGPRAIITATATEVPAGTTRGPPSMVREIVSSGIVDGSEGEWMMDDGRWKMDDGKWKMCRK